MLKSKRQEKRKKYRFAGDEDEKKDDQENEENDENNEQKIEIEMNQPAGYGGQSVKKYNGEDCNGIYSLPHLSLCWVDSFNQYCITFSSGRSRLFTLMGEQHYPIVDDHIDLFEKPCHSHPNANMIDTYIHLIYTLSNQVGKNVNVYTELSPTLELPYQSYNLWRLKQYHTFNKDILYIPMDVREIQRHDFSRQMYNADFRDLTLSDLQAQQTDDCYFHTVLLYFLDQLVNVGGRIPNDQRYEPEHFLIINTSLHHLKQTFDSIRGMIQTLRSKRAKMSSLIKDVYDHDPLVKKIVETYRNAFAAVLDVYTLIQIFRKDYSADHVLFLVGELHSQNLFRYLLPFRVFSAPRVNGVSLNLSGSYY